MTNISPMTTITRTLMTALAVISIAGCASGKRIIVLQHPDTLDTKQCSADPWATFDQKGATEQCAKDFEEAGYIRMGDEG